MTVKGNAPEPHEALASIDWERDATSTFKENVEKAHGRIEHRCIRTLTPLVSRSSIPEHLPTASVGVPVASRRPDMALR